MPFKKYTIIYYLLLQSIVFSDNGNVQYPNIYFDFFNGERKSIEDLTNNGPLSFSSGQYGAHHAKKRCSFK